MSAEVREIREVSLGKNISFIETGLVNSYILKLWAAHPYPKFSRETPPPPHVGAVQGAMVSSICKVHITQ